MSDTRSTGLSKATLLLVDDDAQILSFVSRQLKADGYEVELARNGQEALDKAAELLPDLVILDIAMPVMGGLEVLERLREWSQAPVIVLSATGEEQLKVRALDIGADDYLTKPFGVPELLARVKAALRRAQSNLRDTTREAPIMLVGDVEIDLNKQEVRKRGVEVPLTKTEYWLVYNLAVNAGKVVSHRQLLQQVWGAEYGEETEYLRTFIKQVRKKLEDDPARPRLIVTQPGMGYRLAASK